MKLAVFLFLLLVIPSVTFAGDHEKKHVSRVNVSRERHNTDNECQKEENPKKPEKPHTTVYTPPQAPKQPPVASQPPRVVYVAPPVVMAPTTPPVPYIRLDQIPYTAYTPTFWEWILSFFKVQ